MTPSMGRGGGDRETGDGMVDADRRSLQHSASTDAIAAGID